MMITLGVKWKVFPTKIDSHNVMEPQPEASDNRTDSYNYHSEVHSGPLG